MKISEMTNDQATEAMIRLTGPFNNICEDDEMLAFVDKLNGLKDDNTPFIKVLGRMLPQFVTLALKKHRQDLYEIVGALTLTPAGKVGLMNFKETIEAIRESYDDILAGFFTSSAQAMKKNAKDTAES